MKMSNVRKTLSTFLTYAVWIVVAVATLFPIYWMIVISARSRMEIFSGPKLIQTTFFLENYTNSLDSMFVRQLINSIIIATSNAVLVSVLAVLATYALSRYRLPGSDNIFFWTITNRMAPPAAFLLPFFLLFTRIVKFGEWDLYDTHIGLILLYCLFNLPFAIWLMKGIIDDIPVELDEAVFVDGGNLGQFC